MPLTFSEDKAIMRYLNQISNAEEKILEAKFKKENSIMYFKRMIGEVEDKCASELLKQESKINGWRNTIKSIILERAFEDSKKSQKTYAEALADIRESMREFYDSLNLPDPVEVNGTVSAENA